MPREKCSEEDRKARAVIAKAKYLASEKGKSTARKYQLEYNASNREKVKNTKANWYLKNRERELQRATKWRKNNPERAFRNGREFKKRHPGYFCKKSKEYYKNNPEKLSAQKRARYLKNTDRIKKQMHAAAKRYRAKYPQRANERCRKRRAVKMSVPIGDSRIIEKWVAAWKRKKLVRCYWCEQSFHPKACHTDHILAMELGGPHSIENLCISCASCNCRKNDSPVEKWNRHLTQPVLL